MKKIFILSMVLLFSGSAFSRNRDSAVVVDLLKPQEAKSNHNICRNSRVYIQIKNAQIATRFSISKKAKNYRYQAVDLFAKNATPEGLSETKPNILEYNFIMDADFIKITIYSIYHESDSIQKPVKRIDSIDFHFHAVHYVQGMPMGGISLSSFRDKKDYYYLPSGTAGTPFHPDSTYTYSLQSAPNRFSASGFAGYGLNYVFRPCIMAGVYAGLSYHLGKPNDPLGPLGGVSISVGTRYKFNLGFAFSAIKTTVIPADLAELTVRGTYKSPPALPAGHEKWIMGHGITAGFTVILP